MFKIKTIIFSLIFCSFIISFAFLNGAVETVEAVTTSSPTASNTATPTDTATPTKTQTPPPTTTTITITTTATPCPDLPCSGIAPISSQSTSTTVFIGMLISGIILLLAFWIVTVISFQVRKR